MKIQQEHLLMNILVVQHIIASLMDHCDKKPMRIINILLAMEEVLSKVVKLSVHKME